MINVAIYGNVIVSEMVKSFIENKYNPAVATVGGDKMNVVCFGLDGRQEKACSVPVVSVEQMIYKLISREADVLIIPKDNAVGQHSFPWFLTADGVSLDNVYYADRYDKMNTSDLTEVLDYFTPFMDTKYLSYLEYHLADHCNLNCKACEHYSALVEGEVF